MGNANAKIKPLNCSNEHKKEHYLKSCNRMKYFHVNWNPVIYSIGLDIFISSRFTIPPIHAPTPCGYMCADVIDNVWNWRSYRCREQQYMPCINIIFDWSIKKRVNIYCVLELEPVCLPYETKFQTRKHAHIHEKKKSKSNGKKADNVFGGFVVALVCVIHSTLRWTRKSLSFMLLHTNASHIRSTVNENRIVKRCKLRGSRL